MMVNQTAAVGFMSFHSMSHCYPLNYTCCLLSLQLLISLLPLLLTPASFLIPLNWFAAKWPFTLRLPWDPDEFFTLNTLHVLIPDNCGWTLPQYLSVPCWPLAVMYSSCCWNCTDHSFITAALPARSPTLTLDSLQIGTPVRIISHSLCSQTHAPPYIPPLSVVIFSWQRKYWKTLFCSFLISQITQWIDVAGMRSAAGHWKW